jgi:transcription-repair coupling factor (superfamily II helicase)
MKEKDIEDVFLSFTNGEIQCLISTNIIESGIDIKNANTLIIFNSNLFGLSQLYQLRGRVGRSDKRAYAYLFHDSEKLINKTALKKLQVLANYENLGSNFQLANEDLEIRGAGNLLGDEQSGHVKDIGIELYQSMLKEEVEKQKNNKTSDEEDFADFEFNAYFEYYIPKNYIADDISRLIIYRKLTNAKNSTEIKDIIYEISDRYGNYPYEVTNLINLLQIKIKSINFGIIKINIQKNIIDLTFASVSEKLSLILINMVQDNFIKMKSQNSIQIRNTQNEDLFYSINLFYKKLGL